MPVSSNVIGIDTMMSPTLLLPTLAPSSTTSATNSCPITTSRVRSIMRGRIAASSVAADAESSLIWTIRSPCCNACRSDPQMPHASVRTNTWPACGTGSGTSSTTRPLLRITAARTICECSAVTNVVALDDVHALDVATAALLAGEPVVLPTDTVYGIAALPTATDSLYALKGRPASIPIAVLVESLGQVDDILDVPEVALRLAERFWPGPLTIVLRRRDADETLGVRCPNDDFVRALAGRVGPLSVTSANRHGEATPATVAEVLAVLAGPVPLAIDGGPCVGIASTVVDAAGPEIGIIRAGPISAEEIEAVALR